MSIDRILVLFGGLLTMVFIYWFFFGKRDDDSVSGDSLNIIVDGGYKPSILKLKLGQTTKISILRKDSSSCLDEIVFPEFRIKEYLPVNEKIDITITPKEKGEFRFQCGMNMFHGKIIVE